MPRIPDAAVSALLAATLDGLGPITTLMTSQQIADTLTTVLQNAELTGTRNTAMRNGLHMAPRRALTDALGGNYVPEKATVITAEKLAGYIQDKFYLIPRP